MSKIKELLFFSSISLLHLSFFLSACEAGEERVHYKIHDEIRISSPEMNCNYYFEDHQRYGYHFEYPKLIVSDNRSPLIAFIDVNSKKLVFADITDQGVKRFQVFNKDDSNLSIWPISDGKHLWEKWPIIFTRENQIYLASIPGSWAKEDKKIKVYSLNMDTKQLHLNTEVAFRSSERCLISGLYPYHDKYMLVGRCDYYCWRYLPHMLKTTNYPTFHHNASFLLEENSLLKRQSIEEEGCFSAVRSEYAVSDSGLIYGAWVRNTRSVKFKFDEMIYYSMNKDGAKWEKPIELYAIKDTEKYRILHNLSLASHGESAFLLWQDYKNGIYFAEIKDGKKHDITKISDIKKTNDVTHEPLGYSATVKIASDNNGNAYALWTQNNGPDYQLFFNARIDGVWTQEFIIHSGPSYLNLPDMKVDKEGRVHITYIKLLNPKEPYYGKYGCFYIQLERKKSGVKE